MEERRMPQRLTTVGSQESSKQESNTAQSMPINELGDSRYGMITANILPFAIKTIRLWAPNDSRIRVNMPRGCGK